MSWIARYNGQSVFGNACNSVASPTKNFLEFAGTLQVPRKTFWRLQKCCKGLEKLFGVCRNAAKATENFLAFAGTLQRPRKTFWSLQERCKGLEKLFGVCRNAAKASKNFLEFAGTLQRLRKTFWHLQECCKHFQKRFDPRMTSVEALCLHRTHVNRKRDPPWGTFVCLIVSWSPKRIAKWAPTDN